MTHWDDHEPIYDVAEEEEEEEDGEGAGWYCRYDVTQCEG